MINWPEGTTNLQEEILLIPVPIVNSLDQEELQKNTAKYKEHKEPRSQLWDDSASCQARRENPNKTVYTIEVEERSNPSTYAVAGGRWIN
jgi:hypothetical protein